MSEEQKPIYVKSGELAVKVLAGGPLEAIRKSLDLVKGGKTLDENYFYLDERGFRTGDNAEWRVPVEQGLARAGYFFDDPGSDGFVRGSSEPDEPESDDEGYDDGYDDGHDGGTLVGA